MATELNPVVTFSKNYNSPVKTKYDTDETNISDPSFEKIYEDSDDKYLASRVIYATEDSGTYTYTYDAEGEVEIEDADLLNLFIKGVVCVLDDVYYSALSYDETNGITFAFPSSNP